MKKTAIILGATGLTGSYLLKTLLRDDRYGLIKSFGRSTIALEHPKLAQYIVDLLNPEEYKALFLGDEVFCCIGTTRRKTWSKKKYRKIDHGIPVTASKIAKENGIKTFIVISALGAKLKSRIFYNRTKGEMERDVLKTGIEKTYILQPSVISGKREEKRIGEWVIKQLISLMKFLLVGPLKKYQSTHPQTIATTMVWLANNDYPYPRIENEKIKEIAGE